MTYKQLAEIIQRMNNQQLNSDVTIFSKDEQECYPVRRIDFAEPTYFDVLDESHPYLTIGSRP